MTKHFDFTPSSFGGGWIRGETSEGRAFLEGYYQAPPEYMPPIAVEAYIVEPYDIESLVEAAIDAGLAQRKTDDATA